MNSMKHFEATVDLFELDGYLVDFQSNVERAYCIMQDIAECYLTGCKQEDALVLLGYNEYSIKAQIVEDYLFRIASMTAEARSKFDRLLDTCRADVAKGA